MSVNLHSCILKSSLMLIVVQEISLGRGNNFDFIYLLKDRLVATKHKSVHQSVKSKLF